MILFLLLIALSEAVEVNFSGDWQPGLGWKLVCTWTFPPNDTLQSVRLSRDGAQFKIYRPEVYGPRISDNFMTPDSQMRLDCTERGRRRGSCSLSIEFLQPPSPSVFTCEVSGERPTFRIVTKDYELEPYVPSNDARIEVTVSRGEATRVFLNCSSTGLPAPELVWDIGGQKIQSDFSSKNWNSTTKLVHSWASLSLSSKAEPVFIVCTPEQRTKSGLLSGLPAEFLLQNNSFSNCVNRLLPLLLSIISISSMCR